MLDTILHSTRSSKIPRFMWHHVDQFVGTLLSKASSRAIALVSPHISWSRLADRRDLIQQWAATASVAPHTEEVARGVVDTLLQIASEDELAPYIPADLWSWLVKWPSLPPICLGRSVGTRVCVIKTVQALGNVEVLKSYLLLVWSEWDALQDNSSFDEMCISIREGFSGIGMGHHRAELIRRLDHVLGELDRGLEHLNKHNPQLGIFGLWKMKRRYGKLKDELAKLERCTSSLMLALLCILTPEIHGIPCNVRARSSLPCHRFAYGTLGLGRNIPPVRLIYSNFDVSYVCVRYESLALFSPDSRNVSGVYITSISSISEFVAFPSIRHVPVECQLYLVRCVPVFVFTHMMFERMRVVCLGCFLHYA